MGNGALSSPGGRRRQGYGRASHGARRLPGHASLPQTFAPAAARGAPRPPLGTPGLLGSAFRERSDGDSVRPMNIAVLLHAGAGGSGVVATELGLAMAESGHLVHFVANRVPFRLVEPGGPNVFFHQVEAMGYPLFDAPLTTLAEASKLAEVIEEYGIDVIHAHYAVPHATAAILARDMVRSRRPVVVTTLHGTDVTLVGLNRAYLRTTQFSIEHSDHVTAVSDYLAKYTTDQMGVERDIEVVPNFIDHQRFHPGGDSEIRHRYAHPDEKLVVHVSNFRTVKRTDDVVRIFARVAERTSSRLLMIGDGPERPRAVELAGELGVAGRVAFLGSFLPLARTKQQAEFRGDRRPSPAGAGGARRRRCCRGRPRCRPGRRCPTTAG